MAVKWSELSQRQRAMIGAAAAAELSLKVAALIDIKRRPADRIRGPKLLWRVLATQNVIGPAAYYWLARRRER